MDGRNEVSLNTNETVPVLKSVKYCRLGNFRENFIFSNNVKQDICDVKNSRHGHNLTISVKDRVIWPLQEGFIFTELCICEVSRK